MPTLIELSHRIHDGEIGYPGLPAPRIRPHLTHAASAGRYADGATFEISHLSLVGNTGTYMDSPAHRFPGGPDVASIPLRQLVDLPAIVIDADGARPHPVEFEVTPQMTGAAVLIRTGWDTRRGTDAYFSPAPYLSTTTAQHLAEARPAVVGVDVWNVDDTRGPARPVHTALLRAGVVIVEHLCRLAALPTRGASFNAVPLPAVGAVSLPVRAWARLPEPR